MFVRIFMKFGSAFLEKYDGVDVGYLFVREGFIGCLVSYLPVLP